MNRISEGITKYQEAVDKLKAKLEDMYKEREEIKVRQHESWELSNLGANIRRVKQRIEEIKSIEKIEEIQEIKNNVTLSVDKIDNRVRLIFPSKPDQETINKLKQNGFKWSPYNKAWQRMLNKYSIELARQIMEEYKA